MDARGEIKHALSPGRENARGDTRALREVTKAPLAVSESQLGIRSQREAAAAGLSDLIYRCGLERACEAVNRWGRVGPSRA
jgi:hypothetical protein